MCQIYFNGNVGKSYQKVCRYWRAGKCTRPNCPYLHTEIELIHRQPLKNRLGSPYCRPTTTRLGSPPSPSTSTVSLDHEPHSLSSSSSKKNEPVTPSPTPKELKVCKYWAQGTKCHYGDNCRFLHHWFTASDNSFSMLSQLSGHQKAITGIVYPAGSEHLVSASQDKSLKIYNCHTGQVAHEINLDVEIGAIFTEGVWLFIGVPNQIRAYNIKTQTVLSLLGPVGQVYSMYVSNNGLLLAGDQEGNILAWRFPTDTDTPATFSSSPTACLKGHAGAVISMTIGDKKLYSGSMDSSIRVWDLETMQSIHTLRKHTSAVTSLICWKEYLLSSSLDQTIKVWCMTEKGTIEPVYTHKEDSGVVALDGMIVQEGMDVLMSSCNDNAMRLYQLPSFKEVGRIFAEEEIRATGTDCPRGLFFTGDAAGHLRVWKWSDTAPATSETPV